MAFSKSFERELNKLFRQRTDWLRRNLWPSKAGKPPEFNRKKVSAGIRKLRTITSDALAHGLARSEFKEHVAYRKDWQVKGRGSDERQAEFDKWFSARFGKRKGFIYVFWGNRKCVYVGRTGHAVVGLRRIWTRFGSQESRE